MTDQQRKFRGIGIAMMAAGAGFLVLGIIGQKAFLGVGPALLAIGVVFIGKSRQAD